jgi:hypothetical protein
VPLAPSNLTAVDYSTYVQLNWTDRSTNELGFRVYREIAGEGYELLGTVGANVEQVQDSTVVIDQTYGYYVVAYNGVGESAHSNEVILTVQSA